MKFTSGTIFFILLAIFVGVILLLYWLPEGFIAYQQSVASLNQVIIPPYSASLPVYKMYDSVYFDNANGNVLELFGQAYANGNVDVSGTSLTELVLMPRQLVTTTNAMKYKSPVTTVALGGSGAVVDTSLVPTSVTSSYTAWVYPSGADLVGLQAMNAATVPNYQVLYLPCGTDTLVHLFDMAQASFVGTFFFRQNSAMNTPLSTTLSMPKMNFSTILTYPDYEHATRNTYVNDPNYDGGKPLFQLSDYVFYDPMAGYLVVVNLDDGSYTVYDGTANPDGSPNQMASGVSTVSNTPQAMPARMFQILAMLDKSGGNVVLYVPLPTVNKVQVTVLCADPINPTMFMIKNSVTFDPASSNGVDGIPNVTPPSAWTGVGTTAATPTMTPTMTPAMTPTMTPALDVSYNFQASPVPTLNDVIDNYYTQYFGQTNAPGNGRYSNDFLLKTQIIPPVCPSCPSCPTCPSNVACTNCGGYGGGGLLDPSGNFLVDVSGAWRRGGGAGWNDDDRRGLLGRVGNDVVEGGERVGNDVLSAGETVGRGVWDGAERLGDDVLGGVGAFRPTMLNNDDIRGGGGGYRRRDDGSYRATDPAVQRVANATHSRSTPVSGPDWYSYYGALPSSSSNLQYMPITADFSKFGR